jgi:hypothetical protein
VSVSRAIARRGAVATCCALGLLLAPDARAATDDLASELQRRIAARAPWLRAEVAPAERAFAALPLRFEANRGQADPSAAFVARAGGMHVSLRAQDLVVLLPGAAPDGARRVHLRWLDSARDPVVRGERPVASRSHYFTGRDPSAWVRDVPQFERVRVAAIRPGVDLVVHGERGAVEFDFELAPGVDPSGIRFAVDGADAVEIDGEALAVRAGASTLHLQAPVVYQEIDGERRPVAGRYALGADGSVGFALGAWDAAQALVIDPVLAYSSYLGGSGRDVLHAVAVDAQGHLYVAGRTESPDFPLESPLVPGKAPGFAAFVAKLNPTGTELVWSTFLGGTQPLGPPGFQQMGLDVDAEGNVVVTGETNDPAFPLANAWQSTPGGGWDAYVTKLAPNGDALVFSTLLGGALDDYGRGVAFDPEGFVVVTGITFSADFPTQNAIQPSRRGPTDAFVARFQPSGQPIYSTYLGGDGIEWGYDVAGANLGQAVVVGYTDSPDFPATPGAFQTSFGGVSDAFVARLSASGDALEYATFVGGGDGEEALAVALGREGDAYVVGWTRSADFPVLNAFQSAPQGGDFDAYALRLRADGSALVYSTRLGGSGVDFAYDVAVDERGRATVAGNTSSADFPLLFPVQAAHGNPSASTEFAYDAFVTQLTETGSGLLFSTYLGGDGVENPFGMSFGVAVDPGGHIYLGQTTASTGYPRPPYVGTLQRSHAGGELDGVVTRISTGPEATLRLRPGPSGIRGRFRLGNGAASLRPVELRFWVESPALGGVTGVLTLTSPLFLPARLDFFELSFQLPTAVAFPGSRVGLRLLDPVTGEILSESLCWTLPCN